MQSACDRPDAWAHLHAAQSIPSGVATQITGWTLVVGSQGTVADWTAGDALIVPAGMTGGVLTIVDFDWDQVAPGFGTFREAAMVGSGLTGEITPIIVGQSILRENLSQLSSSDTTAWFCSVLHDAGVARSLGVDARLWVYRQQAPDPAY